MPHQSPLVTVIIPTYNSSATLKLAMESVLKQDCRDFELRVVGDGCTDGSESAAASFDDERVHWVNLPSNSGGPSIPRNEGLRLARGRYIAYLSHDDLWFPWHLSGLIDCLESTKSDFVCSMGAVIGREGLVDTFTIPKRPYLWRTYLSPGSWLHLKSVIEVVGLWSTQIRMGHDAAFLQRVMDETIGMAFSPHLSIITFPAALWRRYSSQTVPQRAYVEAMRQDAEGLRIRLLTEAAALLAREERMGRHSSVGFPKPLASLARLACDIYGRHRWPLNQILYWVYRRNTGSRRRKKVPAPSGNSV